MSDHSTPATAYSYIRFSTSEQAKGNSIQRQTEAAAGWCERNGVRFDTKTTLHDFGKSAYTGKHRSNPDRHALAAFLQLVESGRIASGSYLIVESLDRLTREHIRPALTLMLNLIEAGVAVVQLKPVEAVYDKNVEPMQLMMALMELSRGNSESRMKSDRVGKAWRQKKIDARHGTHIVSNRLPAWVQKIDNKLALIPDAAAAVRRIFQLARAGYGVRSIVKKLKEEDVPPIGRTGRWCYGYVASMFVNRYVLGEYQPKKNKQTEKDGDVIRGYYPAVITEDEWLLARAAIEQRKKYKGRIGGERINIFAGILKHARDGDNYIMTQQQIRKKHNGIIVRKGLRQILINRASEDGQASQRSLPYDGFERVILSALREIDPHDVLNGDHPPDKTALLAASLVSIESELAQATAWMDANGFSATIAKRIVDLESSKAEMGEQLAHARMQAAHPLSESWGETQSLIDALRNAPDQRDARLRLRSALRRIVESMHLLIVMRGHDRLCAVQIWFAGGKRHRDYLLHHQVAGNHRAEAWQVRSFTDADMRRAKMPQQFDLRHACPTVIGEDDAGNDVYVSGWQDVEMDLLTTDLDLLFASADRLPTN